MKQYGNDSAWPFSEGGGTTIVIFTSLWATAVLFWSLWQNWASGIFLFLATVLWLFILYFFRDPNRKVINKPGLVIGPGDGEVVEIVHEYEDYYLKTDVIRISMFLSVTDVHVQRTPLGGEVTLIDHQPGQFLPAFNPEASDVNEYIAMVTETEYGRILIKQIAGILARRCVNNAQPGDDLQTGQRFGLIKFGSRLDLYLPPKAQLLIKIGDKIVGGLTPIAQLTMNN